MVEQIFNAEARTKLRVAAIQMNTQSDTAASRAQATALIRQAAAEGAEFICTPEYTNILRNSEKDALPFVQPDDGRNEDINHYTALAKELGVWINIGSLSVLTGPERMANRSFLINPQGEIVARYDKIHMFDVDLPDGHSFRESDTVDPGHEAVVAQTPFGKLGMSICYDLRFPDLFQAEADYGATIFTTPSAYSMASGKRTWEHFLCSRAAESGSFVIAAAQCGKYEGGENQCWGQTMIVNPWGEVIARGSPDKPGIISAELDLDDIKKARAAYPVQEQRLKQQFRVVVVGGEKEAPLPMALPPQVALKTNSLNA